jgi:hypothetical protein
MQKKFLFIMLSLLIPSVGLAQKPQDSWENVMQVPVGQKLKVVDMKWKAWTGRLVNATEEAMTLQTGKGEVTVAREEVLRVTDLGWSKRGRNALIGFAVGTLVGTAVVAGEEDLVPWGKIVIATGMFGAPGALVGAAIPSHPTIYRAKPVVTTGSARQ